MLFSFAIAGFCFMLFNLSTAWAQSPENGEAAEGQEEVKPLQIGDTIPEELWHLPLQVVDHPEEKDTITLNDYRDKKLIILDFWATWCGSCMASFEKLHDIYEAYGDKVEIVPITLEGTKQHVIKKLSLKREQYQVELLHRLSATVGQRQIWQGYFPHRVIPHHVWMDQNGKVVAITDGNTTNQSNISAFLNSKSFHLPTKKDVIDFDRDISLLKEGEGRNFSKLRYHSSLFNHLPGIKGFVRFNFEKREKSWIRVVNMPLLALYKIAYGRSSAIWPYNPFRYDNRVELRVSERSRWEKPLDKNLFEEWTSQNSFCYESTVPGRNMDLFDLMQEDLERYFGFRATVETKPRKAWVISKLADRDNTGNISEGWTGTGDYLESLTQLQLANYLADHYREQPYPFVPSDEGAMVGSLTIDFNKDLGLVAEDLKAQGYNLVLETVELDILVISDKDGERRVTQ